MSARSASDARTDLDDGPSDAGPSDRVTLHARVVAERNDCEWCDGNLTGRAVPTADRGSEVSVTCDDCGHDYV
jgi:hypothetical protein